MGSKMFFSSIAYKWQKGGRQRKHPTVNTLAVVNAVITQICLYSHARLSMI